jgi:hypothetical protein
VTGGNDPGSSAQRHCSDDSGDVRGWVSEAASLSESNRTDTADAANTANRINTADTLKVTWGIARVLRETTADELPNEVKFADLGANVIGARGKLGGVT